MTGKLNISYANLVLFANLICFPTDSNLVSLLSLDFQLPIILLTGYGEPTLL